MLRQIIRLNLILIFVFSMANAQTEPEPNLLSGSFSVDRIKRLILSPADWHPFPTASETDKWQSIPEQIRTGYVQMAEQHLGSEWATPKASVFLEFKRNGNRENYQRISFGRRKQLAQLVLGECVEGRGRFLDDIVNGIWTICEETYWGVPAHVSLQAAGSGLADVTEPTVDLFAAETGMMLAWIDYLLGAQLDAISPLIRSRIRFEVKRRIIDVNLERDDFWWLGFQPQGRERVNNWNPWICSNWLTAVLLLEDDPDRRARSIFKIMRALDQFLNPHPRDGGCDEGPNYWGRAGGSLYDCLELLASASNNAIQVFDRPLIHKIGQYICQAHIDNDYFINFADASARVTTEPALVYRFGKAIQDSDMMAFAAYLAQEENFGTTAIQGSFGWLNRVLPALFTLNELARVPARALFARDIWFPDLQVMAARSAGGTRTGLFVAAQGGHNAESHNHNDVGNFIIYVNGMPAIIDVGVETYTAKTFSQDRYDIWTMQSGYHNLPTVNGFMQMNGREFQATQVQYHSNSKKAGFSLDLSQAYPAEAGIKSYRRTITLNRGKYVLVQHRYELQEVRENLVLTLMTSGHPTKIQDGKLQLNLTGSAANDKLQIDYDPDKFTVTFEAIPITDERLLASWDPQIYRILLTAKQRLTRDQFTIRFHQ